MGKKNKNRQQYQPPAPEMTEAEEQELLAKVGNKLFVYGIFLGAGMRNSYNMSAGDYATVKGYATYGGHIVTACKVHSNSNRNLAYGDDPCLTGLLVTVPDDMWGGLDRLEAGYKRIVITTTGGVKAYMYAERGGDARDYSSYGRKLTEELVGANRG